MKDTVKKELSHQAQVAKRIRNFCKELGIKCKATSDSFSMGDSVHWTVENVEPVTVERIEDFANQHQYGHFNGMEDIYEYSNNRKDIPQSKYVSGGVKFTDDFYQKAWELLKNSAVNGEDKPQEYEQAKNLMWSSSDWNYHDQISRYVYEILSGNGSEHSYTHELSVAFWQSVNKNEPAKVKESTASAEIQEHTHTKFGFQMFIVITKERLNYDAFNELRDECNARGGWYSRKWGATPCGFAFKELTIAEKFLNDFFNNDNTPEPTEKKTKTDDSTAQKLEDTAAKMQSSIDEKMRARETHTPKKLAQARHAMLEGERLERTQKALYKLAALHKNGDIPEILADIKTKKAAYDLLNTKKEMTPNGFHTYYICTGEPADTTPKAAALWALLDEQSEEQKTKAMIQRKIDDIKFSKIAGFFPTPKKIINLMIEKAQIKQTDIVLEPSAGWGAICDEVQPLCKEVRAFEANHSLSEILSLKGYLLKQCDFLTVDIPHPIDIKEKMLADCVLMNPPFENLQDVSHVMHAFEFLKDGGRLVSIMSPSAFFREDLKSRAFRQWLENLDAELLDIPAGEFKESGTNIATKLLVINK